jgi:hypothetical protein
LSKAEQEAEDGMLAEFANQKQVELCLIIDYFIIIGHNTYNKKSIESYLVKG